ncbi:unnamed protein product [Rotaria sp. Silwood1]|nr:unnamed protein product [Rotaria sp. Silwood1]
MGRKALRQAGPQAQPHQRLLPQRHQRRGAPGRQVPLPGGDVPAPAGAQGRARVHPRRRREHRAQGNRPEELAQQPEEQRLPARGARLADAAARRSGGRRPRRRVPHAERQGRARLHLQGRQFADDHRPRRVADLAAVEAQPQHRQPLPAGQRPAGTGLRRHLGPRDLDAGPRVRAGPVRSARQLVRRAELVLPRHPGADVLQDVGEALEPGRPRQVRCRPGAAGPGLRRAVVRLGRHPAGRQDRAGQHGLPVAGLPAAHDGRAVPVAGGPVLHLQAGPGAPAGPDVRRLVPEHRHRQQAGRLQRLVHRRDLHALLDVGLFPDLHRHPDRCRHRADAADALDEEKDAWRPLTTRCAGLQRAGHLRQRARDDGEAQAQLPQGRGLRHRLRPDALRADLHREGRAHAVRGRGAGRAGRHHLPADLARFHHPAGRRAGVHHRHVRRAAAAGLLHQHADAVRPRAGHRHRGGRCHRRGRERRAQHPGRPDAAQRDDQGDAGGLRPHHRHRAGAVRRVHPADAGAGPVGPVLQAVRRHHRHLDEHLHRHAVFQLRHQRAAAVRQRGPREGQADGRAAGLHLRHAADQPRLAVRQRLHQVRQDLPGHRAGRRAVPRQGRGRRAAQDPQRRGRDGATGLADERGADLRPDARHALQRLPVGRHQRRAQARLLVGPGRRRDRGAAEEPAARLRLRVHRPGLPGPADPQRHRAGAQRAGAHAGRRAGLLGAAGGAGAGRSVRELEPAAGHHPDRADVHPVGAVRRVDLALPTIRAGGGPEHLHAGGAGCARRSGVQERHPDRRVRQGAGREGQPGRHRAEPAGAAHRPRPPAAARQGNAGRAEPVAGPREGPRRRRSRHGAGPGPCRSARRADVGQRARAAQCGLPDAPAARRAARPAAGRLRQGRQRPAARHARAAPAPHAPARRSRPARGRPPGGRARR